jgi:tetratricopeptide (TPR) repeat protein
LNAFEETGGALNEEETSLYRNAIALRGEAFLERGQYLDAKEILKQVSWAEQKGALAIVAQVAFATAMVELGEGEEAAEILTSTLTELQPGDPARFRALRSLGRAQCLLGLFEEAQATWELGWTAAREQTSPEQEGLCLLGLGETLIARGRLAEARTILQRAESRLRGSNRVELAACLVSLGELDLLDGYYRKALARAEDANAIAQQAEDLVLSVRSLELCSLALASVGMDRDAERLATEAEGLRRAREVEAPLPSPRVPSPQDAARLDFFTALEHHLQTAVSRLPSEGCRGLELQLQAAISRVTGSPESKSRATALAISVMDTLPPELAAAFSARDELSHFLG